MSTNNNQFKNPYQRQGNDPEIPLTSDISFPVSRADHNLIKCTCPSYGVITHTLTILFSKLCNELRTRQITDVSRQDDYKQFVANCHIISDDEFQRLHNGPVGESNEVNKSDDRSGTPPVRSGTPTESAVVSDIQGQDGKRRKGKERDKRKEKGLVGGV